MEGAKAARLEDLVVGGRGPGPLQELRIWGERNPGQQKGRECGKPHVLLSLDLQMLGLYWLHVFVFMRALCI